MDKLTSLRHYSAKYYQHATQLQTSRAARAWMEAGVPADEAGRWASVGFLPEEALPLIASGMTPEQATAADPTTDAERIKYLADRIDMLRD